MTAKLNDPETEDTSKIWVRELLSSVYLKWVGMIDKTSPSEVSKKFEKIKLAAQFAPQNTIVQRELVRLANSQDPEISQAALEIYDPATDPDPPGLVLNELGSQALERSKYGPALDYFKRAREKSPTNAEILNNLAYAYLTGPRPQPQTSLKLIDQAMRFLPKTQESREYLTYFRDTRGQALMQIGKFTAAIREYELALLDRPNSISILKSLAACYRASGLDPSPYLRKIEEIESQSK